MMTARSLYRVNLLTRAGLFTWFWFRDVAPRRSVYRRSKKDEHGRVAYLGKYEPRFKPPREKVTADEPWIPSHLALGGYDTQQDAETVHQIAGFYYGKDEGRLELGDGTDFLISRITELERDLVGKEKAKWVSSRAKEVFKDFTKAKAARTEVPEINVGERDVAPDSSLPTEHVPCSPCVNPTPSTNELLELLLDAFGDSNTEGLGSISLFEFADLGSGSQVDWGSLPPLPFEVGSGRGTEDISVSDYLRAEPNCQERIDAPALILDRNDANESDLNSKQECLIEEPAVPQEEFFVRELNRRISEQPEPHRLREQQLEEENFKLKRENEQIPELKREIEQFKSALLQVLEALRPHFPAI